MTGCYLQPCIGLPKLDEAVGQVQFDSQRNVFKFQLFPNWTVRHVVLLLVTYIVHFFHFFMEIRKYSGYVFQGFLYFACSMSLVKCIFLVSFHREWHLNLSPLSQETCYLLTGSLLAVFPRKLCQVNRLKQKYLSPFCETLAVRLRLLYGSALFGQNFISIVFLRFWLAKRNNPISELYFQLPWE